MGWQTVPQLSTIEIPIEGAGEACTISIGQWDNDAGGQVLEVYATLPDGSMHVGNITVTARAANLYGTRVAAFVALPGVQKWLVLCRGTTNPAIGMPLEVSVTCGPARAYSSLTAVSP